MLVTKNFAILIFVTIAADTSPTLVFNKLIYSEILSTLMTPMIQVKKPSKQTLALMTPLQTTIFAKLQEKPAVHKKL